MTGWVYKGRASAENYSAITTTLSLSYRIFDPLVRDFESEVRDGSNPGKMY